MINEGYEKLASEINAMNKASGYAGPEVHPRELYEDKILDPYNKALQERRVSAFFTSAEKAMTKAKKDGKAFVKAKVSKRKPIVFDPNKPIPIVHAPKKRKKNGK